MPRDDNLGTIRRLADPIPLALVAGSAVALFSAILLAQALELPQPVILSLSLRSTTGPVALRASEAIGGIPTQTAVLVILAGVSIAISARRS